jgi:hypothetical protein
MDRTFDKDGRELVKGAISPELTDFITRFALMDEIQNYRPEAWVHNQHTHYAPPVMEALLMKLHPTIEKITGLTLYPTYSLYRVYRNGSTLPAHRDRASCEITASVCFGYNYDDDEFQWPLYVDGDEFVMEPGDMVVYRGIELEHWRKPLAAPWKVWQVQAFLHYVNAHGPVSHYKFDGRECIGAAKPMPEELLKEQG